MARSNRTLTALRGLTIASLKMYFRNRTALFFSLFFPLVFITVFGFIFKNTNATFKIDVVNQSETQLAQGFSDSLHKVPAFKINEVSASDAADDLNKGNADLTVTIPEGFGEAVGGRVK